MAILLRQGDDVWRIMEPIRLELRDQKPRLVLSAAKKLGPNIRKRVRLSKSRKNQLMSVRAIIHFL
jgi:hypothetical protein